MHVHDVLVIGCGPGGSTVANLLAGAGLDVAVFERQVFPRFHVGESLLPVDLPIFQQLGLRGAFGEFQVKRGAEFYNERTGEQACFSFSEGLPGTPTHAYQVDRATFDDMLAKRAQAVGAAITFGVGVEAVDVGDRQVRLTLSDGRTVYGRYLVDASGQDAVLAKSFGTREPLRDLGRAAVFCHYNNLRDEVARELQEQGNVKILMVEDGWQWVIPLAGGRLSTGIVLWRGKVDLDLFQASLKRSAVVTRLIQGATPTPAKIVSNFSFRNQRAHGSRFVCIGDAGCFLDPIFSSGVSLAMQGASKAAEILLPALKCGDEGGVDLMGGYADHIGQGYAAFEKLIRRLYHSNFVENLFFA
ncbi:MAG: NAD(P)/FAD-dependent oxidoreductase, partial [Nannocystaceae bacterium]